MRTKNKKTRVLSPRQRKISDIVSIIKDLNVTIDEIKRLYSTRDLLLEELVRLKYKNDQGFIVVDNFKDRNVAFRTVGVHRYEIKRSK